ncbi:MAG: hypothetical protein IT210_06325 [Armatimonadetes bacterium]|nr:hypothetical protein [Armatimonadota bacterium]
MSSKPARMLWASLFLSLAACAGAWEYSAYDPAPSGVVRIARPDIVWRIRPGKDTEITDVSMTLNGQDVAVVYSESRQAVLYAPQSPLAPGAYEVDCKVVLNGRWPVTRKWRFTVSPEAVAEIPAPNEGQKAAWETANAFRQKIGLPPFRLDARLCAAASAHSRYLQMNGEFGHEESPGKAGYVGADLMMRLTAFGYGGGAYEDINLGRPTLGSAVRSLFDAPYHRIPFLQPGSPDFGIGTSGRITTLDFGRTALSETAVSPGDGQRGVPSAWNSIETPDPLRLHEVKRPVGYVIVFVYYTPDNERIRVTSAFLTDSRGREIPFFLNAPTNDNHLTNAVFLIPRQPLKPANTYTVSVDAYAASGKNISREWNFTTAAPVKRKSK